MIDFQTFETIYISIYVIVIILLLITYIFVVLHRISIRNSNFIREDINKNNYYNCNLRSTSSGKTFL